MKNFLHGLFHDDSLRPSMSKTILFLVAIISSVIMIKLTVYHQMSVDYFISFLAFGTGHASMSKYLDKKGVNHNGDTPDPSSK